MDRTNAKTFAATMVEPTGVPARIETMMPRNAHITEMMAEDIVTFKKLLKIFMEESAGKITRADISSEPTRFIASTIITAIITAVIVL